MHRFLVSLVVLAIVASTARAGISYQYVTDASSSGGTIQASPGQDIPVRIYLQETVTGASSSLVNSDGGLSNFGVSILTLTGSGTVINDPAAAINTAAFGGPTNFNPGTGTSASQGYLGAIAPSAGTPGVNTDASGKILLATAHLIAGASGTSTTFQVNTGNSFYGPGNTLTNVSSFDLDSTNNATGGGGATYIGAASPAGGFYSFTVTVAAVPEPSSLLLCGLATLGGAYSVYRRRKASKAQAIALA